MLSFCTIDVLISEPIGRYVNESESENVRAILVKTVILDTFQTSSQVHKTEDFSWTRCRM